MKKTNKETKRNVAVQKHKSQLRKPHRDLTLNLADPSQVMAFGKTLKNFIIANNLSVVIEKKDYPLVDAWKFAGFNFGLTGIPKPPVALHTADQSILALYVKMEFNGKNNTTYWKEVPVYMGLSSNKDAIDDIRLAYKGKFSKEISRPFYAFKCECDIVKISDGNRVSFGEGMCDNLEEGKVLNTQSAINSHSQTRAISRGFRNLLGFVMSAADMQTTPGEEMDDRATFAEARIVDDKGLLKMTPEQFDNAVKKVRAGELTLEAIKKNSSLNEDQEKAIAIIESTKSQPV